MKNINKSTEYILMYVYRPMLNVFTNLVQRSIYVEQIIFLQIMGWKENFIILHLLKQGRYFIIMR